LGKTAATSFSQHHFSIKRDFLSSWMKIGHNLDAYLLNNACNSKVEPNRFNYENPTSDGSDRTLDKNAWREQQPSLVNANALQLGRVLGGRYQLLEVLGEGGMSAVFLSRHKELDQLVAIKVLRFDRSAGNDALRRFLQEAKATFQLNHPNLIRLLDFSSAEEDLPYLVMEYVSGKTLAELLREKGRLEVKDVVDIFSQVCDGLAYAHARGIVHRDMKPSNIMLATEADGSQVVKIVDFGIAKMAHSDNEQQLTKTGEVFGSPFYMSPEQCRGLSPDHRSDLYSIGCAMFECLSGSVPYCGENSIRTLFMHIEEPIPTLKLPKYKSFATTRALEEILQQLLQKDPGDRFQKATEVKKELLACLELTDRPKAESTEVVRKPSANLPSKLVPPNEVPGNSGLNGKVVGITVALLALAVVIGGSAFSLYSSQPSPKAKVPALNNPSEKASIESDPAYIKFKKIATDLEIEVNRDKHEAEKEKAELRKALGKIQKDKESKDKEANDREAKDKANKQKKAADDQKRIAKEQKGVQQAHSKLIDRIRDEVATVRDLLKEKDLTGAEAIGSRAVQETGGIEANNPVVRSAYFTYLSVLMARPDKERNYSLIVPIAERTVQLMPVKPAMTNEQQSLAYGWLGVALNKTGQPKAAIENFARAAACAAQENTPQGDVRFADWESGKFHAMAHTNQMAEAQRACIQAERAAITYNKPPLALFILKTTEASLYFEDRKIKPARDAIKSALDVLRQHHLEDNKREYNRFADVCNKLKMPSR
jgi:serine/threonine protein kinase